MGRGYQQLSSQQSCGGVSAGGVLRHHSLCQRMKKRMASLIGILAGCSVLWIALKGGFEAARSPGDAGQRLEGKSEARESRADSIEGIHDILAGRRPLPGKFEELEKLARGLSDLEIRSLLDQRQDVGAEGPWTWVRCALWSIVGERADGLDGMPEKPSAVPEGIPYEQLFAANLRAESMAMDWASFLRGFSRKEPGLAWSQLIEKPDLGASGGYAGDEILDWVVKEVVANWATTDPAEAYHAILEHSGDSSGVNLEGLISSVRGFHFGAPSERRAEFIEEIPYGHGMSHYVGMHGVVAGAWARSEPDLAFAWLREQLPTDRKLPVKYALGCFLGGWTEDPEGLYRWCENVDLDTKQILGDRLVQDLLYSRPRLAAALVEDGWEMQVPPDWEELVRSRRAFSPSQPVNRHTLRAPWTDWKLTDQQWRSNFRLALPVFGVPEDVQKELLESLDQYLMKSTKRDDEEVDR